MAIQFKRRLSAALAGFRNGGVQALNRREIPAITVDEVAEIKEFFPLEKFFIFGHARSGTTILARVIRQHQEVHCHWQAHFFTRPPLLEALVADPMVGDWLGRANNRWNRGRDLSPVVLRAAADIILEREARREGKRIVGDKSPSSLLDGEAVRLMYKVYPDGHLIYIVRDGRDTVLSHRFQNFIEFPQFLTKEDTNIRAEFARNPDPFLAGERSVFTAKGIRQAAEGWVRNVRQTEDLGRAMYGDHYLSLRYEDLLERSWMELERIWSFLGAGPAEVNARAGVNAELQQNLDTAWQSQKSNEIARSLQKGKHGSWQVMFTSRDRQVFEEVAGETLAAWGYGWD
jgi:hypothetical protein